MQFTYRYYSRNIRTVQEIKIENFAKNNVKRRSENDELATAAA